MKLAADYGEKLIEHGFVIEQDYWFFKELLDDKFLPHCLLQRQLGACNPLAEVFTDQNIDSILKYQLSRTAYLAFVNRSVRGPKWMDSIVYRRTHICN